MNLDGSDICMCKMESEADVRWRWEEEKAYAAAWTLQEFSAAIELPTLGDLASFTLSFHYDD